MRRFTTKKLATKIGCAPTQINVWHKTQGFPDPIGKRGRSYVWDWQLIEPWLITTGRWKDGQRTRQHREHKTLDETKEWALRMGWKI